MTKVDAEDIKKEETVDKMTPDQEEMKDRRNNADAGQQPEAADEESGQTKEQPEDGKKTETKEPEEDWDTKYLRLMADFQNYRKRVEKEKSDIYSYANEKILTEMLEVLDNFERALGQEATGDGFKEGMEMIFKQLSTVLEKSGLAEIIALGEEFDPNVHHAVMTEETDEYESGKVSGVMQKGYTLNGKVIRPSMVKVVG